MTLSAFIESVGLLGPGLADWPQAARMLAGDAPYLPEPTRLPPPAGLPAAERRRTGPFVKVALAVGHEAAAASGRDAATLATVFSSSGGDGQNCHAICETLASDERLLSPTRFHNSVHNAPAGYWGIATGCRAAANSLCAHDASFGAGLLEAVCQVAVDRTPVLLIAYDTSYPEPMRSVRPIPYAFGVAMLLSPARQAAAFPHIELSWSTASADRMEDPALERLRGSVPAARSLPLLELLARGADGCVRLDYLDGARIELKVSHAA